MLRDFLAGDRRSRGRLFGIALLATALAACAAGCGIKGPLRQPPAPPTAPATPDAAPTTPSEPEPAAPKKQ